VEHCKIKMKRLRKELTHRDVPLDFFIVLNQIDKVKIKSIRCYKFLF